MNNPAQHVLNDDDALFFYHFAASKRKSDIKNRQNISTLASKLGITIKFEPGKCKSSSYTRDCIHIYGYTKSAPNNKLFFWHLRNAYAHLYIEISGDRCILLDWNPYGSDCKKQKFTAGRITMKGDVSYDTLQKLLRQFFSDKSKTN